MPQHHNLNMIIIIIMIIMIFTHEGALYQPPPEPNGLGQKAAICMYSAHLQSCSTVPCLAACMRNHPPCE